MSPKQAGPLLMMLGGLLILTGGTVRLLDSPSTTGSTPPAAAGTTTTITVPGTDQPTTTIVVPSTNVVVETTTTTEAPVTTSTTTATTTTFAEQALVEVFITEFSAALQSGDDVFVFSRLHPDIVAAFGEVACRTWVNDEIMALSAYQLEGQITGPTTGALDTPAGTLQFPIRYTAPVSFQFSGQSFSVTADFVVLDGVVYFTGTCE